MATNNTQDFATFITPVTSEVLFEEYTRRPNEYDRVFNVFDSRRNFETDSQLVGFGAMPEMPEGTPVTFDKAIEGFSVTYTHVDYGLGYRITKKMRQDDLTSKIMQLPKALAVSVKQTVETVPADLFNSGFSTVTGGDGSPLFSTSHSLKGGGTGRNRLAIDADLGESSLKDALVDFEDTTDDRGIPLIQLAQNLVVPNALRYDAQVLLKSRQKPASADNDFNPLSEHDLDWFVWHYLTDTDAWFLLGDIHFLKFFWRQKPMFDSTIDFDTDDIKQKVTSRFVSGHSDWRGVYGSPGI